jgi:hypothetical protein
MHRQRILSCELILSCFRQQSVVTSVLFDDLLGLSRSETAPVIDLDAADVVLVDDAP